MWMWMVLQYNNNKKNLREEIHHKSTHHPEESSAGEIGIVLYGGQDTEDEAH